MPRSHAMTKSKEIFMNNFFKTDYNWGDFIGIAFLLLLFYVGLRILKLLLDRFNLLGSFQKRINEALYYLLLIYEPLAGLILASVFVMVAPRMNGLIVLLMLILGGGYFKNYLSGRFLKRNKSLVKGTRVAINDIEGVIYDAERFGIQLQTERGQHFLSYSKMLTDGYTVLGGERVGSIFHLKITADNTEKKINHKEYLMDRLASTPYLDRIQKPILEVSGKDSNSIDALIPVKEASHLADLRTLLNDWGYSCESFKK